MSMPESRKLIGAAYRPPCARGYIGDSLLEKNGAQRGRGPRIGQPSKKNCEQQPTSRSQLAFASSHWATSIPFA
jgi:hypothetical protein